MSCTYLKNPQRYENTVLFYKKKFQIDVVLIHGLRGSVGYTWRQNDASKNIVTECWPKDWIPLDISQPMRILGIDYPSYILQFTGTMESLQVSLL